LGHPHHPHVDEHRPALRPSIRRRSGPALRRIRTAFESAVEAAKVDDFRFRDLRHTFASWAVQRGASLHELKDLLGHSSLAMVMRYAHLAPENLRQAVSKARVSWPRSCAGKRPMPSRTGPASAQDQHKMLKSAANVA
jgi:integrase